jgi:HSP20 family protein
MRTDPFRDFERLVQQAQGTRLQPTAMPMDAYRDGDRFVIHFDVPGVDPTSVELTVEKNVLTVSAERHWNPGENQDVVVAERPQGSFNRQLFLGENLDAEQVEARCENGVLTVVIPVAERAKPRKVEIASGEGAKPIDV